MSYANRGGSHTPTAKITTKSTPRSEQPAHTKPFKFENEKGRVEKIQEDEWRPGKRMNITAQDTGRIQNKTIVSVESPDWMKSFFENNRAYFEKQGLAQKLKKQDMRGGDTAAGAARREKRGKKTGMAMTCDETGVPLAQTIGSPTSPDWMKNAWVSSARQHTPRRIGERAGKDRHTAEQTPRDKSASEMQHLLVSDSVPEWMRSAKVVEVMAKGPTSARRPEHDDSRAAGVTTERFWDESTRARGGHLVHPLTGKVVHKAQQSDDFPLDSGRNHRVAFEETMRQRPQSARAPVGIYAGDRSKEFRDKKKGAVVDQTTGKVANNSIVSHESPSWMKEPFENNRGYFNNKGVTQKIRALSAEELRETEFIAGRKVPERPRKVHKQITNEAGRVQNLSIVSRTAPEWMKSPFESNRNYFENAGIAQSKDLPRSRSAPPSKTPTVPPEPSPDASPASLEAPLLQVEDPPPVSYAALSDAKVREQSQGKVAKGIPCHAEQRSERQRKSGGSVVSAATSKRSSSASATYSARHPRTSQSSVTSRLG